MDLADRLVEADVAHYPRRQAEHEPVQRVDLAGARVAGKFLLAPGERLDLAAPELLVTVGEGSPGDGSLPPGDRADVDRPDVIGLGQKIVGAHRQHLAQVLRLAG